MRMLRVSQIGAVPLPDNKPENKYVYEILTFTGDKNTAACDSEISVSAKLYHLNLIHELQLSENLIPYIVHRQRRE